MQHDIPLEDVVTIEDLVGGEFVHTLPPDDGAFWDDREPEATPATWKPNCPEAHRAIHNAISTVLRPTNCLREQNRREVYVEIVGKLHQYLRRRYGRGPHRITNRKFLQSPKRAGWLYLFALNTAKHWMADRIRRANGDRRVKEFVEHGVIPAETFTERQERQASDNNNLVFDRYQFGGGLGHAPDSMTIISDHGDVRNVEHASHGDAELAAAIREEISRLSQDDQEFFEWYIDGRYQAGGRSSADRQRFRRIRLKIKQGVMISM